MLGIPFLNHRKFALVGEGCPDSFTILPRTFSVNIELRESEFLLAFQRALALAGSFPMRPSELKKGFNCCGVYSRTRTRDADHPRPGRPGTTRPGGQSGRHGLPRPNRQCWGSAKNKKPGVLPPPVVVGAKQHNMDIGTWDGAKQNRMLPPVIAGPPGL